MDAKELFRKVSGKMRSDFELAAQFSHKGTRGAAREETLRQFFKGRLPAKYALGAGEVVGHVSDVSRQCDIILYDAQYGLALKYDDQNQIYPIDSVYGVIEVKSALSKAELRDSLDKIKTFKEMSPGGAIKEFLGGGYTLVRPRPKPFGIVFAYTLGGNSLDSLRSNLREWEAENPSSVWPNYVCVLGEGCIQHQRKMETCIDSEAITGDSFPIGLRFEEDSLFKFYCALHDMCSRMRLGPVELDRYFEPGLQIGRFRIFGRLTQAQLVRDGVNVPARLKESTLEKIVAWCAKTEKITYSELLKKQLGSLPVGLTGDEPNMKNLVYLYNPDGFPGMDELRANPGALESEAFNPQATLLNVFDLVIDDAQYVLAAGSISECDWDLPA